MMSGARAEGALRAGSSLRPSRLHDAAPIQAVDRMVGHDASEPLSGAARRGLRSQSSGPAAAGSAGNAGHGECGLPGYE